MQRRLAAEHRFEAVQGAILAAPAGGWTFRLELVKEFSGSPPDDGELLAGLADDPDEAGRLVTANRAVYDRVRAAGGTLYPVSALPMSPADWRGHFGAAFGPLGDAKRVHDPDKVLTPRLRGLLRGRPDLTAIGR